MFFVFVFLDDMYMQTVIDVGLRDSYWMIVHDCGSSGGYWSSFPISIREKEKEKKEVI